MSNRHENPRLAAFGRWAGVSSRSHPGDLPFEPPTDVYVEGDTVVICMEVAGVAPDGIELLAEGRVLVVGGERPRPACYHGPCHFRQAEISYGPFRRVFEFPESLDQAELNAQCADGFLTIRIRPYRSGPRRIDIEHAE